MENDYFNVIFFKREESYFYANFKTSCIHLQTEYVDTFIRKKMGHTT